MPGGRPALPLGGHGRITREQLPDGRWRAKARYRGLDGVTRKVQRDTPAGQKDTRGVRAEEALKAAIAELVGDASDGLITARTELRVLVDRYLVDLDRSGKAVRTRDTYRRDAGLLVERLGSLRVHEASAQRLGRVLDDLAAKHGATSAKRCRTVLSQIMAFAVREGAIPRNPVRDVEQVRVPTTRKGPERVLTSEELAVLVDRVRNSTEPLPAEKRGTRQDLQKTIRAWTRAVDLADPIVMLAGTGLRRSELLGLRWEDVDLKAGTLSVTGHVVRAKGKGLVREDVTKTASSARTIAIPGFVVEMLTDRRENPTRRKASERVGVIFASTAGTLRDPDNLSGQWRRIRGAIGFEWVGTHSFRKSVATRLDEAGLSARVAADMLGHSKVSMTQDVYQARRRVHDAAAAALELPPIPKR
ncbi:site-specific integrase [Rhodococcus aetherivorans]|uniref:site-specific integrase n=1 Tax=Rhodococcus aetherivorans TaxID=191292 RepID=UPI001E64315B|nr:site-specific integrase [Rhodococcus aetherivorans]UGQ39376.1 site-specific integrase [Rhodococcus aetherivorans]